jgi:hypothetical protein
MDAAYLSKYHGPVGPVKIHKHIPKPILAQLPT